MTTKKTVLLLFLILTLAFILRFWGINFALPYTWHADEEIVIDHALRLGKDLNPHWFKYPSLYFYLLFFLYSMYFLTGFVWGIFPSTKAFANLYFENPTSFYIIGRSCTALLGIATVLLVYFVAKKLYGKRIGLMASFFLAVAYLHVKDSHFGTVDVPMVFFVMLSVFFAISILKIDNVKYYIFSGIAAGFAIATKYPAGIVILPLILAHFLRPGEKISIKIIDKKLFIGIICIGIGFLVACPYSLLDWKTFVDGVKHIIVHRKAVWPYQWMSGLGFRYYLIRALPQGLGWPVFLLSLLGLSHKLYIHNREDIFLASFPLAYYISMGSSTLFFERFIIPVLPFLVIFAAYLVDKVVDQLFFIDRKHIWKGLISLIAILPSFYQIVRTNYYIFSTKDVRIIAKNWTEKNIPSGTKILSDRFGPPLELTHEKVSELLYDTHKKDQSRGTYYSYLLSKQEPEKSYYVVNRFLPLVGRPGPLPLEVYFQQGIEYIIVSGETFYRCQGKLNQFPEYDRFFKELETKATLIKKFDKEVPAIAAGDLKLIELEGVLGATKIYKLKKDIFKKK